jgi:hypothetical protein
MGWMQDSRGEVPVPVKSSILVQHVRNAWSIYRDERRIWVFKALKENICACAGSVKGRVLVYYCRLRLFD